MWMQNLLALNDKRCNTSFFWVLLVYSSATRSFSECFSSFFRVLVVVFSESLSSIFTSVHFITISNQNLLLKMTKNASRRFSDCFSIFRVLVVVLPKACRFFRVIIVIFYECSFHNGYLTVWSVRSNCYNVNNIWVALWCWHHSIHAPIYIWTHVRNVQLVGHDRM